MCCYIKYCYVMFTEMKLTAQSSFMKFEFAAVIQPVAIIQRKWLDRKSSFSWIILRKARKTGYAPAKAANHPLQINANTSHHFNFSFWTGRTKLLQKNALNNRHNECYCCFQWCATCSYMLTYKKMCLGFHDTLKHANEVSRYRSAPDSRVHKSWSNL